MVNTFLDILGITEPNFFTTLISTTFCSLLIFFGILSIFNILLSIVGGIMGKE